MKRPRNRANINYKPILRNKYALSTVVTTLIILVISVLLASVVTYFAINVVSTRVQEESLHLTKQHIYHNAGADPGDIKYSQASLMVVNTGGRDVVIDKLAVRGQECAWADTASKKFVIYCITQEPMADDMIYQNGIVAKADGVTNQKLKFTSEGDEFTFLFAENDLVLPSGSTMLIYIVNPDSITINDIGLTVSITLYTAQAMYYREANVQAIAQAAAAGEDGEQGEDGGDPEPPAADVTIIDLEAYYNEADADASQGALIIKNNGQQAISITGVTLNNIAGTSIYYYVGDIANPADLSYIANLETTQVEGHDLTAKGANPISVPAGSTAIIYFTTTLAQAGGNPLALSVAITDFAAETTEVTVEAAPEEEGGVTVDQIRGWYAPNGVDEDYLNTLAFVITNDGDTPATITWEFNGEPIAVEPHAAIGEFTFEQQLVYMPALHWGGAIEGHELPLVEEVDHIVVPAGQTAIVYLLDGWAMACHFPFNSVGQEVQVDIQIEGGATISRTVTLELPPTMPDPEEPEEPDPNQ